MHRRPKVPLGSTAHSGCPRIFKDNISTACSCRLHEPHLFQNPESDFYQIFPYVERGFVATGASSLLQLAAQAERMLLSALEYTGPSVAEWRKTARLGPGVLFDFKSNGLTRAVFLPQTLRYNHNPRCKMPC